MWSEASEYLRDIRRPDRSPTLVAGMLRNLQAFLPTCPDPGMALTNLGRFLDACPAAEDALSILALDPRTAEILVQLFSTSQFLSEQMIRDAGPADVAADRGRAARTADLLVARPLGDDGGVGRPGIVPPGPAPLPQPGDAADRLQRYRPRPAAGG